ncbi:hypothetical protein TRIATDRAFT_87141 [Trichoderma atroviride IMI 206040]|uniref:Uncharacterized protein n=1 Tax=Hypocrea atroviridis (strain ATCC 20476 / IMI 206040) TaxID=452589 RepID=G9P021_HYPAI|nr:uncharacterized protein TRIATDRAFT_87141 [Trichoderma atroviride IMI 206040]EHK44067.1 hypothetical protein TRIATDRAFT_87141 [Trichoderma atroviride IMI 206040]
MPLHQDAGEVEAGISTPAEEYNSHLDRFSGLGSYFDLARDPASSNKPSAGKQKMAFEETVRSISSHLPSNMSRRRARSQIASPIVDFDVATAEKPYRKRQSSQPVRSPKCYYIINPRVPGLAWYLTKGKGDSNSSEYEVEKVPAHLVHIRKNQVGYLVETANGDDVTVDAGRRPVSWTPRYQNGWSTAAEPIQEKATSDSNTKSNKRVNRFDRDDAEEEPPSDESSVVVNRRDIPLITKSIIRHLHAVRPQERFYTTSNSEEEDEASSSQQRDLESIVEAALFEYMRPAQHNDKTRKHDDENTSENKMPVQIKLESEAQRINPRPSIAADPTITLSVPETSFTIPDADRKHNVLRKDSKQGASTTTALLSPQRSTAITWTKDSEHLEEPTKPPTTDNPSDENSGNTADAPRASSCPSPIQHQDSDVSQTSVGASSIASSMTSFPKLLSRHCTREWIKPLASLEDRHHRPSSELYYQGNESQAGQPSHAPYNESSLSNSWTADDFQSRNASGYFSNEVQNARRSTMSHSSLKSMKGFGSQIGAARHRRRSTTSFDPSAPALQDNFLPNILSRFFLNKSKETPGSPDSKETLHSGALAPYNSPIHGHYSANTPRSGNGSFIERSPALSVEDRARIQEVLVEGPAAMRRRRCDTCSEDNRPHVCEEDIENRVR